MVLVKERAGIHRLWGKREDEEVDRISKLKWKERWSEPWFKTFAELYTHFLFINIPVSQLGSSCTRLQWKITEQLLLRYKCAEQRLEKKWDCVAWAQGIFRTLRQGVLRKRRPEESILPPAGRWCRQRQLWHPPYVMAQSSSLSTAYCPAPWQEEQIKGCCNGWAEVIHQHQGGGEGGEMTNSGGISENLAVPS